jgi:putative membrane protein
MVPRIAVVLGVSAVVVCGTVGVAAAEEGVNQQDRTFLIEIHQANLDMIEHGPMVERTASAPAVRELAKRLVSDHTALDEDVKRVAGQVAVPLPSTAGAAGTADFRRMAQNKGAAFDRAWLAHEADHHHHLLQSIAQELREGSSLEVKKLAAEARPAVRAHLALLGQVGGEIPDAGMSGH